MKCHRSKFSSEDGCLISFRAGAHYLSAHGIVPSNKKKKIHVVFQIDHVPIIGATHFRGTNNLPTQNTQQKSRKANVGSGGVYANFMKLEQMFFTVVLGDHFHNE